MTKGAKPGPALPQPAELTAEAQSLAASLAQGAKDKAMGVVEQRKAAAAEHVDSVARVLDSVAAEVEQGAPVVAPYLRDAATSIHRVSSTLRERSTDDLLHDLGDFARRRPAALLGVSLAAGFALARLLKSSADRRAAGQSASRAEALGPAAGASSRTTPAPQSGSDQPSEAELADALSPVAGMASLADVSAAPTDTGGASTPPTGTSTAGGGAEAPEPSKAGGV